jgi:hypothetical protein
MDRLFQHLRNPQSEMRPQLWLNYGEEYLD